MVVVLRSRVIMPIRFLTVIFGFFIRSFLKIKSSLFMIRFPLLLISKCMNMNCVMGLWMVFLFSCISLVCSLFLTLSEGRLSVRTFNFIFMTKHVNWLTFNPHTALIVWNEDTSRDQSMTVPDQTLTVKQLIDRYQRGLPVPGVSVIDVDMDISSLDKLDRFQRIDLSRELDRRKAVLQQEYDARIDDFSHRQAKLDFDKAVSKAVEAAVSKPEASH